MLLDFDPLCPSTRCVSSAVSAWAVIRVFTQIIMWLGQVLLDKINTKSGQFKGEHVLNCIILNENKVQKSVKYEKILHGTVMEKLEVAKRFKENFDILENMKKWRKKAINIGKNYPSGTMWLIVWYYHVCCTIFIFVQIWK